MEAMVLNRNFEAVALIDTFESFIWTERYNSCGDFEYYAPIDMQPVDAFVKGYYLYQKDSDRLMIIEDIAITTDPESGVFITVSGRSLESILERRIVWYRTQISGSIEGGIATLLRENFINPVDPERRIPNLRMESSGIPDIDGITMEGDYLGENIYDIVSQTCAANDIGYKITWDGHETLVFKLYVGKDRSYDQDDNPWVVFSPDYDNLADSNYFSSDANLRTAAIVVGSETNNDGQAVIEVNGFWELEGLDRRELMVDGGSVSTPNSNVNEDAIRERGESKGWNQSQIDAEIERAKAQQLAQTTEVYYQQLEQLGYDTLAETYVTESFEGEIDATRQYIYGQDFFIGDIVQIRNEYGMEAHSRVTEVVRTHDLSGESVTPTFTAIEI